MEDPVSGKEYEASIAGVKRWAAHELPYGVPLLYALAGFLVITTLLYGLLSGIGWIIGWTLSGWTYIAIVILGLFWGFGGWQHGADAQADLDIDPSSTVEKHDP